MKIKEVLEEGKNKYIKYLIMFSKKFKIHLIIKNIVKLTILLYSIKT